MRNLREVSPTMFNNSVPSAWSALVTELERDPVLARSLLANAVSFGYGGASLPGDVFQRIQRVAEQTVGEHIVFCSGLGSTETTAMGVYSGAGPPTTVGTCRRADARRRGSSWCRWTVATGASRSACAALPFSGYVKRPDLTAAAFDDEGYFCLGDAVRLADPADPARGLVFAGRVVEDFKLANGTWVRTGAVRLALIDRCAPLITDAVICGHDHQLPRRAGLAQPRRLPCAGPGTGRTGRRSAGAAPAGGECAMRTPARPGQGRRQPERATRAADGRATLDRRQRDGRKGLRQPGDRPRAPRATWSISYSTPNPLHTSLCVR
ncbi:hypothetical protein ACU4GD_17715 [Cupriavidus basilensis]